MKAVIGGVIGGIIVLSVIILFPTQIDTAQEMIKQESIHPCQKAGIEHFKLYKKQANLLTSYSELSNEEKERIGKEFSKKLEQLKQITIENNCNNLDPEWWTEEFQTELEILYDKGF